MKRVKSVVAIGLSGFCVYVVLAVYLIQTIGFLGVALAASVSSLFNLGLYMIVVHSLGVHIGLKRIAILHIQLLVAAVVAGTFGYACRHYSGGGGVPVALNGLAMVVVFIIAAAVVGSLEARSVIARIFAGNIDERIEECPLGP